jgi:hypothetical protein
MSLIGIRGKNRVINTDDLRYHPVFLVFYGFFSSISNSKISMVFGGITPLAPLKYIHRFEGIKQPLYLKTHIFKTNKACNQPPSFFPAERH